MFGYDNLANFYKTNFNMMYYHKYSLNDIEKLIPWERQMYIDMLASIIAMEKEKTRELESNRRSRNQ
jgi:hypothetical protein